MRIKYTSILASAAVLLALNAESVLAQEIENQSQASPEAKVPSDSQDLEFRQGIQNQSDEGTNEIPSEDNFSRSEQPRSVESVDHTEDQVQNNPTGREETAEDLMLFVVDEVNQPLLEPIHFKWGLEAEEAENQLQSNQAMLSFPPLTIGKTYQLKLDESKSNYQMPPLAFKVKDMGEGYHSLVSTDADERVLEKIKVKKLETPVTYGRIEILLQNLNGEVLLDPLTYVFTPLDGSGPSQSWTSKQGMLQGIDWPMDLWSKIELLDSDRYQLSPLHFKLTDFDGMSQPILADGQPLVMLNLEEKNSDSSLPNNSDFQNQATTSESLSLTILKNGQPLPRAKFRLFKWDEFGIPSVVLHTQTNDKGQYQITNLAPHSQYEVRMEEKSLKFDQDAVRFKTDEQGYIAQVAGQETVDELIFNGHDRDFQGMDVARISFKVINKNNKQAQSGVVFTANTLTPNLQSYKNATSNEDGIFTFELEGQEGGKQYSITLSKNAQFLWDFEPEEIVISVDGDQQVTFIDLPQDFQVVPHDRTYILEDFKSKLKEAEDFLSQNTFADSEKVALLQKVITSSQDELAKPETTPYYALGFTQDLSRAMADLAPFRQVEFANPVLRREVNMALSQADHLHDGDAAIKEIDLENYQPTVKDMANLKRLHTTALYAFSKVEDRSLKGLETASHLEYLSLNYSGVDDFSALQDLTQLRFLSLANNDLRQVDFVQTFKNLEELNVSSNAITDLTPLMSLKQVKHLNISENQIQSLQPLHALTQLNRLNASNNQIKSLAGLNDLNQLSQLQLAQNQLHSLEGLPEQAPLKELDLSENQLKSIEALSSFRDLEVLYIIGNQITDLRPLSELDQLKVLSLRNNQIRDVSPLENLTHLRYLHLYENQIEDIRTLEKLSQLSELNISKNQVQDISVLKNMPNLEIFFAYQNRIQDVSPLNALNHVKVANLAENAIYDLSPLQVQAQEGYRPSYVLDRQKATLDIEILSQEVKDGRRMIRIANPIRSLGGRFLAINLQEAAKPADYEDDYVNKAVSTYNQARQDLLKQGIMIKTVETKQAHDTLEISLPSDWDDRLESEPNISIALPFLDREAITYDPAYVSSMPDILAYILEGESYSYEPEFTYSLTNPFSGVLDLHLNLKEEGRPIQLSKVDDDYYQAEKNRYRIDLTHAKDAEIVVEIRLIDMDGTDLEEKVAKTYFPSEAMDLYHIDAVDRQGRSVDISGALVSLPIQSGKTVSRLIHHGDHFKILEELNFKVQEENIIFEVPSFSYFSIVYANKASDLDIHQNPQDSGKKQELISRFDKSSLLSDSLKTSRDQSDKNTQSKSISHKSSDQASSQPASKRAKISQDSLPQTGISSMLGLSALTILAGLGLASSKPGRKRSGFDR